MSDDGDHENEKTSSLLWPAYVLDHEDGTRMVVLNVATWASGASGTCGSTRRRMRRGC
jgi:hypothetical protein